MKHEDMEAPNLCRPPIGDASNGAPLGDISNVTWPSSSSHTFSFLFDTCWQKGGEEHRVIDKRVICRVFPFAICFSVELFAFGTWSTACGVDILGCHTLLITPLQCYLLPVICLQVKLKAYFLAIIILDTYLSFKENESISRRIKNLASLRRDILCLESFCASSLDILLRLSFTI